MTKKIAKPVITKEKLGINPFLTNLKVLVNNVKIAGQWSVDKDGDMLPVMMELEKVPFSKVFLDSERRNMMVSLSPRAKDLLLWVIYECEPNEDWIWINKTRYMSETGVSAHNTYIGAVNELIRHGFIIRTTITNVYWINPHYFFNGNRVKCFPNNIVSK